MLKNLLEVLLGSNQQELNDEDEKIALAALCVRVAKSDNVYDPNEISSIDTELSQHFSISADDAAALRLQAEELENDAPDTVRFTRAIKEKIELGKRRAILETLWKITLADGKREAEEDSLIRLVSSLLGLTDVENAQARQKVMKK